MNQVHVMRLKPKVNPSHILPHTNGHMPVPEAPGSHQTHNDTKPDGNGTTTIDAYNSKMTASFNETLMNGYDQLPQDPPACALSENELNKVFGHFGGVERILLPVKPNGRRARHASISKSTYFTLPPIFFFASSVYKYKCVCFLLVSWVCDRVSESRVCSSSPGFF